MDDDSPRRPGSAGASATGAEHLEEQLRRLQTERDRLKATILRREALLRAAARALRRYHPGDRVAASIDTELGDGIDL